MIHKGFTQLKELLKSRKKIVLIGHKNPDGDAIGSTLALSHYLRKKGHFTTVIMPNEFPLFLKWIPGAKEITNFEYMTDKSMDRIAAADIIFTLDFNTLNRTQGMEESLTKSKAFFAMIDHHQQPGDYAKYMYSDTEACSTCQMVYEFIDKMNDLDKIDADIATCIYTGIMTDTGSFRFRSTTSKTHRIVADLIDKGANNSEIHNLIYDTNSYSRLQLKGKALQNLISLPSFKTAYITLTQKELDEFNYQKGDTEGLVNYALSLKGVIFAAIFIENKKEEIIKISFRSKGDFSVNQFSRNHFGGGGHNNAAGGKSDKNMQDTIKYFIDLLPEYKDKLTK